MTFTTSTFRMGSVLGRVELPQAALDAARAHAASFYAEALIEDFCGYDEPETLVYPAWLPALESWFPVAEVAELGYRIAATQEQLLVLSVGVESHTDAWGPTFMVCLANDGLMFRQASVRHMTEVGEWFIFDDKRPHELLETMKTTTFIGLNIPLERIAGTSA
jgi:hypothetical protein